MPRGGLVAPVTFLSNQPPSVSTVETRPQGIKSAAANHQASKPPPISQKPFLFTKSQLSLALSIVKSKPPDLSTREYCIYLRKHIKLGRAPLEEDRRYIDTSEFWKDQYSKLYLEKIALEGNVARLEQIINQLEDSDLTQRQTSHNPCKARKRKASMSEPQVLDELATFQSDPKFEEPEYISCLDLLKQSRILHELIGDSNVSTETLIKAVISSVSRLKDVLSEICSVARLWTEVTDDGVIYRVTHSFNIAAAVFNLCLKGLAHLCRDISGRRSKGQVIYSLVHFFTTTLQHLHELCSQELLLRQSTKAHHLRAQQIAGFPENNKTPDFVTEISKFLVSILTCPDFQSPSASHAEVLEGLFFTLLTQIGGLISQNIFQTQLASSKRPGRISSNSVDISIVHNAAVDLEGRHLVYILKRVLNDKNGKDRHTLSEMLSGAKVFSGNPGEGPLSTVVKRRLQETLLKGVFGQDGSEFICALKIPQFEEGWENEVAPTSLEQVGTFVESVWSVIGWDLVLKP